MLKHNGKLLMRNIRIARTGWQRLKGLMFEDIKKFNYALIFEMPQESKLGSSLHMIFVYFPIDVVFLNSKKEVVDKVTLKPFMPNYTPKKAAKYVIEMPEGRAKKIKIRDEISWQN
jgi:uncharacterized protein